MQGRAIVAVDNEHRVIQLAAAIIRVVTKALCAETALRVPSAIECHHTQPFDDIIGPALSARR
jgi:hypothetical protein